MITASIVLYKTDPEILLKSVNSFLASTLKENYYLFLIDNSPADDLKNLVSHEKLLYFSNPDNPGFGAAHNIAIKEALKCGSRYHFIINPDVYFGAATVSEMVVYMDENNDVGMLMPQILNEDGSVQYLPKLLPSPGAVLMRKLKRPTSYYDRFINRYELRSADKSHIYSAPVLSGCFTTLRLDAIKEVGMYDERFFMYFEDWDLSRRMHLKYRTVYFPLVSVTHSYESGANKSRRLFGIFIKSAITYFNKWGWIFDSERDRVNKQTLQQFK